jgi:hypothetical protein
LALKSQNYFAKTKITEIHFTTSKKLAYIKTCDTIQVKLEQKPCHIKMAQLSDSTIFLRTYIGAVHNKITDNKLTM